MYSLLSIEALIRIAFAIALLFVVVPALAWPRRENATFLERLFWNIGVGITILTLFGQILTIFNLFSLVTLLVACSLVILLGQSAQRGVGPWSLAKRSAENTFLAALNVFDRRISVPRRIRRRYRRTIAAMRAKTSSPLVRLQIAAWLLLTTIAAVFRLYRPMFSANLGFSDTYVHLYLVKLLEEGRQVDPAFGPYPRGMHFVLMAIHELTNVDQILLMNFFGAVVGVLMTLAVADTTRRLSGNVTAGLTAGLLFATLVGGAGQYFVLGGAFATADRSEAISLSVIPYADLAGRGREFDLALIAFQRQTSTLSQELAIALLFPATMFLLNFFRKRGRWDLIGFAGCTAAIAAVHSGVLIAFIVLCAIALAAVLASRALTPGTLRTVLIVGAASVLVGSAWALAFIAYPYAGGRSHASLQTSVGTGALYYFPFLRSLASEKATGVGLTDLRVFVSVTPFLILCSLLAIGVLVSAFVRRDELRANRMWIALVFLVFLTVHFSSRLAIPEILETTRNSQWLMMSMMILAGVAAAEIAFVLRSLPKLKGAAATALVMVPLLLLWTTRVPLLSSPLIHDRIVNYSGYGGSALAVLRIQRSFEPYTWTLISYGQEFPMVLRRGFHLPASDFLERYDPNTDIVPIPTPNVFVIVEKTPHPFQINAWAARYDRAELERRLQTWIHLYQATHNNLRVFLEDENVRVYQIQRTPEEIERMSRQVSR